MVAWGSSAAVSGLRQSHLCRDGSTNRLLMFQAGSRLMEESLEVCNLEQLSGNCTSDFNWQETQADLPPETWLQTSSLSSLPSSLPPSLPPSVPVSSFLSCFIFLPYFPNVIPLNMMAVWTLSSFCVLWDQELSPDCHLSLVRRMLGSPVPLSIVIRTGLAEDAETL